MGFNADFFGFIQAKKFMGQKKGRECVGGNTDCGREDWGKTGCGRKELGEADVVVERFGEGINRL